MIVISDTSAITALLQIGRADLLEKLYGTVLIPEAVRDELLRFHNSLPAFLQCKRVQNYSEAQRLGAELDLGEAEAITLAKELRADLLLIDDLQGRRVASREGVLFIGLLGVLVQAKQSGLISSLRGTLLELETIVNFRLSEEVKSLALRKTGEL